MKKKNWFVRGGSGGGGNTIIDITTIVDGTEIATLNDGYDFMQDVRFSPDGLKFFISHYHANGISEFTMTTPFSIATATFVDITYPTQYWWYYQQGFEFSSDGTLLFFAGNSRVISVPLSTAWDISTYGTQTIINYGVNYTNGIYIRQDGLKIYLSYYSTLQAIREFDLSTAWDISSYTLVNTLILTDNPKNTFFSEDGSTMYICFSTYFEQWDLSTAWDISTAVLNSTSEINATGMYYRSDVPKVWLVDRNQKLREYNI